MSTVALSVNNSSFVLSRSALEEIKGIVRSCIAYLEEHPEPDSDLLSQWFQSYLEVYAPESLDTSKVFSDRELIEFWAMFNGLWPQFLKTGLEGVYMFILTFRTIDETKINEYNIRNWSVFNSIAHSLETIIPYCKDERLLQLYAVLHETSLKTSRIKLRVVEGT